MSRRRNVTLLATVLCLFGVGLIGLGSWWFLRNYERVEEAIDLPRTGEARRNPLFALQLALQNDGVAVQSRRRLELATHKLADRDTVLLLSDPRTITRADAKALLIWVERGGHLIARTPDTGLLAKNTPVPLLSLLGLQALPDAGDCVALEVPRDESHVEFCGVRRFMLTDANPRRSWGDLQAGYVFARLPRGRGSVDVIAALDFLTDAANNEAGNKLKDGPHIALARQLLAPNYRDGTVHLIYAAQMPSLWMTLFTRSWMVWGPLLLAFCAWLWWRMQRFGPLRATQTGERRSLLEHITASGEHIYRYGYGHLLHAAARNAFLARLRRRDPQAAALEGEVQIALLVERFNLPANEIRDALSAPVARDHAAFRTRIATLIRLRNQL